MDYIGNTFNTESGTNYLKLSDYAILFFMLNILVHDLSHDVTKERVNKKMKQTQDILQSPIEQAPTPDAAAAAADADADADATAVAEESIDDLNSSPHFDTIINVSTAILRFDLINDSKADVPPPSPPGRADVPPPPPPGKADVPPSEVLPPTAPNASSPELDTTTNDEYIEHPPLALEQVIDIANTTVQPSPPAKMVTRSRYRQLQRLAEFVDETKMVVIGKIKSVESMRGGKMFNPFDKNVNQQVTRRSHLDDNYESKTKSKRHKVRISSSLDMKLSSMLRRKVKATKKINSILKKKQTRRHKSAVMRELQGKLYIQRNINFSQMLKSAFHQVVGETNGDPEYEKLNKYYRVMAELYSSFKADEHVSPFDIFNLSFIKEALVLHLIYPDLKPSVLLDAVIQSRQTSGSELKGGGRYERLIKTRIESLENDDGVMMFDTYKGIYMNSNPFPSDAGMLEQMRAKLASSVKEIIDSTEYKESEKIRRNIILGIQKTIEHNELTLAKKSGGSARSNYIESLKKTLITNYLKILFDGIYDACDRAVKEDILTEKKDKSEKQANAMNLPIAKIADKPCKIVRTVARGCLKFIFKTLQENIFTLTDSARNAFSDVYPQTQFADKSLYISQLAMVRNIAAGFSQGGETLDSRLLNIMKLYVNEKKNANMYSSDRKDKDSEPFPNLTRTKYQIINNGAKHQLEAKLKLDPIKVICPLSSILDPMGSFGSCSTTADLTTRCSTERSGTDLFATDIYISNKQPSVSESDIAYYGKIQQSIKGTDKKGIIQYGFRTSDYCLPIVVKVVDMARPNIIDLSVTNTYESIINRIVYSWNNLSPYDASLTVNDLFEQLIMQEGLFTDLISCSTIKNCGDLYQELNSSFVNRGYSFENIRTEAGKQSAIAGLQDLLIGIHQDRPAASRNMFLLVQDDPLINRNAIGGYVSPTGYFFVKRK